MGIFLQKALIPNKVLHHISSNNTIFISPFAPSLETKGFQKVICLNSSI
jgi:hypothetical protein